MTKRLQEICAHIPRSVAFADVGCDHGYCAKYVLENGLAERVYITDISQKCLDKAIALLKTEIEEGRCIPLVGDGVSVLPEPCTVLIAGMGGEEIVKILTVAMPPAFVLQPMKNSEKVRRFLIEKGCKITRDYTFEDGAFYDLIVGVASGGDSYSEREFLYGRDNLRAPTPAFRKMIRLERDKLKGYLSARTLSQSEREKLQERLQEKENLLHEIE